MSEGGSKTVKVRAPTRLDLGGGWTDVPPYCEEQGGFVCNVAITRYATATITADRGPKSEARGSAVEMDEPLIHAALRRSRVADVQASLNSDFPRAAGLGGSSAASAALLGAITAWRGEVWDPCEIAEEGRRIEVEELGIAGGRQDHYAATYGGALALTFTDKVGVRRIALTDAVCREFERRSILLYTGESRVSGRNITEVVRAYHNREARVIVALGRMKALAEQIAAALGAGDIDSVGSLMGEHWTHQRALHPAIPTPLIDEIVKRARASGALGAKAMGASGGGCVLIIAGADDVPQLHKALAPLGTVVNFGLDAAGMTTC